MNVQTFLYNENFYKKLALTMAIIRQTPSHSTPRDYTRHLQNVLRRNQVNEAIQFEQVLVDVCSLRKSAPATIISIDAFDLLAQHAQFLQHVSVQSADFNIELQALIIETIDRVFDLIKENLDRLTEAKCEALFKQAIGVSLNFDIVPNIQKHCVQHVQALIGSIFVSLKQPANIANAQTLIEHIGCQQSYFLLVFQQVLIELFAYLNQVHSDLAYGSTLIRVLQKLVASNASTTLEQILNDESVRQQLHALLHACLAMNNNDTSLAVCLWNIYGRIL